jgi:CubicO group peptidase (beta-lactamase class C family)
MAGPPPFDGRLVSLANWQEPPFNRWSFQHIRELIPTAQIPHGEGSARRLPRAEHDLSGLRFRAGGREMTVAKMLDRSFTDGFLVLHRGRVVFEEYRNGMTPETPHLLMSVSKSVVAAVAGILVGRGALDPSAPVEDVVPELRRTSFRGATVQHLLDMRAGTRFDEDYDDPTADVRVYEQVYLWRPRSGGRLPPDALAYIGTLRNEGEHGGPFFYRSILTDVLGWVVERAGGARLHELIARELWAPMGAEFDADITVDSAGNPMADGGISATLRDLGRFGQLYLDGGVVGRRRVVPEAWISDTSSGAPDGPRAFREGDDPPAFPRGAHYRNCWWIYERDAPLYAAAGINGQHIFVHGPTQTVVVKLSTWPLALSPTFRRALVSATLAIGEELSSEG